MATISGNTAVNQFEYGLWPRLRSEVRTFRSLSLFVSDTFAGEKVARSTKPTLLTLSFESILDTMQACIEGVE